MLAEPQLSTFDRSHAPRIPSSNRRAQTRANQWRMAQDRFRVSVALSRLPLVTEALNTGELCYSAVRELTRVAVPSTEEAWLDAACGQSVRKIEELVAFHLRGDLPGARPSRARLRRVTFEVTPEVATQLAKSRHTLAVSRGARLSDTELVALFCTRAAAPANDGVPGDATHPIQNGAHVGAELDAHVGAELEAQQEFDDVEARAAAHNHAFFALRERQWSPQRVRAAITAAASRVDPRDRDALLAEALREPQSLAPLNT